MAKPLAESDLRWSYPRAAPALRIHTGSRAHLISSTLTIELLVTAFLLLSFIAVRVTLDIERPPAAQHLAEMLHEFVTNQAGAIMGRGFEPHLPFVTTILLFIGCCNLAGLLPGIHTPTATPSVPLAVALLTFLYSEFHAVRVQGVLGYLKSLGGPIWWTVPLILPVEIISHLNRNVSLTVRVYANMYASDLLTLVFFSLVPIGLPVVFLGLHFGVALIQCYVFMLLALIYLAEANAGH
ncbi:ATP synthase F0 sector subunit a [Acidisarcina polymorpha]|uniref:ATP synthase subunit a n=1 Tax=Acidisarcina polymorpha TaxID=2211140 RepID=A0A2Z5G7W3_9BACT|nr:F0F1 ATP synthase subunit A [Acidisarcina polymorpha]AXC15078.1 ATP synthase F0 sector subunit a [Acidisarcina polymorpha]